MSLKSEDLKHCVLPFISIDEFMPKLGTVEEVIVLAFYLFEREPADDLNTFIQRGVFDIIDSDVSPNPDENGHYVVFVEFERVANFFTTLNRFLIDVEKLTGEIDWQVKPYLSDKVYDLQDPLLPGFVVTDPGSYVDKVEFIKAKKTEKDIKEFLTHDADSFIIEDGMITICDRAGTMTASVIDVGRLTDLNRPYRLSEQAINMSPDNDINLLRYIVNDDWNVYSIKDYVVLEHKHSDKLMILTELERVY